MAKLPILPVLVVCLFVPGCGPSGGPDFTRLHRAGELTGQVDRISGIAPNGHPTISVPEGPVEVLGWAVDGRANVLGSGVYIEINGQPLACDYGVSRPDVASALNSQAVTYSGYDCRIPADRLRQGLNTIRTLLLAGDREYLAGAPAVLDQHLK